MQQMEEYGGTGRTRARYSRDQLDHRCQVIDDEPDGADDAESNQDELHVQKELFPV